MLAWSEGTDNGCQKTRNHGYDVIVGGELFIRLLRSPSQPCWPLNSKTQINRRRTLPASSRWWDAYRKQLGPERFSPKSQDAVALQQIGGAWRFTYDLIGISVRQSTVAAISGFTAGRWLWSVRAWADSLIAKFKEAGRNGQRD